MHLKSGFLIAATLFALPSAATAQDLQPSFQMPSGNVFCQVFENDDGTDAQLRCDIRTFDNTPPPPPEDCELDWGYAFELGVGEGTASRMCAGDTISDVAMPVLAYGETWEYGDYFQCQSERTGLTCRNQFGNGFLLSRKVQKLY